MLKSKWINALSRLCCCLALIAMVGIAPLSAQNWEVWNSSNSEIPSNSINSITLDLNSLWVGTAGHGLCNFDGYDWEVYNTNNSPLPGNDIRGIATNFAGTIWIAVYGYGLASFDGLDWTLHNNNNSGGFLNDFVGPVWMVQGVNTLWVGTFGAGLYKFDGTDWVNYNMSNSDLPSDYVYTIINDQLGHIWVGTEQGLAKFDHSDWTIYNSTNSGLTSNLVRSIAIDADDVKWIGTDIGGLHRFDDVNWTSYTSLTSGIQHDYVQSLSASISGELWVATGQGGLSRFDGGINWQVYDPGNCLIPDENVTVVLSDANDNRWIGTQTGGLAFLGNASTTGLGFNVETGNNVMQVFPNPTDGKLTIEGLQLHDETLIELLDLTGCHVHTFDLLAGTTIDLNSFRSGIYFLRTRAGTISSPLLRKVVLAK